MGPMRTNANASLPSNHWIHQAMAKEQTRMAKKKAMGGSVKGGAKPQAMSGKGPVASASAADCSDDGDHEYR